MLKRTSLSALLSLGAMPMAALADLPNWNFVEASYVRTEGFGSFNDDLDGYEIAGSFAPTDWSFLNIRYLDEDGSSTVNLIGGSANVDLTRKRLSAGVGVKYPIFSNSELYGRVAYEDWTLDATFSANGDRASDNVDEDGYSTGIGIRSVVFSALELRGEVAYFDLGELDDGWAYELGAYYTFAEHFTVGASYLDYDDPETYRFTLRYQF